MRSSRPATPPAFGSARSSPRGSPPPTSASTPIDGGRFGRLPLGDTYVNWWRTQEHYDSGGWRGTWASTAASALMNQPVHNVDLLYWFMGDVESIVALTATLAQTRIEVEDTAVATLRFRTAPSA